MSAPTFGAWMRANHFHRIPEDASLIRARDAAAADPSANDLTPDELEAVHAAYCHELNVPRVQAVAARRIDADAGRALAGIIFGGGS